MEARPEEGRLAPGRAHERHVPDDRVRVAARYQDESMEVHDVEPEGVPARRRDRIRLANRHVGDRERPVDEREDIRVRIGRARVVEPERIVRRRH